MLSAISRSPRGCFFLGIIARRFVLSLSRFVSLSRAHRIRACVPSLPLILSRCRKAIRCSPSDRASRAIRPLLWPVKWRRRSEDVVSLPDRWSSDYGGEEKVSSFQNRYFRHPKSFRNRVRAKNVGSHRSDFEGVCVQGKTSITRYQTTSNNKLRQPRRCRAIRYDSRPKIARCNPTEEIEDPCIRFPPRWGRTTTIKFGDNNCNRNSSFS